MSRRLLLLIACIAVAIAGLRACRDEHAPPEAPDHPLVAFVRSVAEEDLGPRPAHAPTRAGRFDEELTKLAEPLEAAWPRQPRPPREHSRARSQLLAGELSLDEAEPWLVAEVEASAALAPRILELARLEEGPAWPYASTSHERFINDISSVRAAVRALRLRLRLEAEQPGWLRAHCVDVFALGRDFARATRGRAAFQLTREALEPCAAALLPADDPADRESLAAVRGGWIDRMQDLRFWHARMWTPLLASTLPAEQVRRLPVQTGSTFPTGVTDPKQLFEIGLERRELRESLDILGALLPEVLDAFAQPSAAERDARLLALQVPATPLRTGQALTDRLMDRPLKKARIPDGLWVSFDDRFSRPSSLPLTLLETALAARAHHCATGSWPSPSQLGVPHLDPRNGEPLTLRIDPGDRLHVQAADLRDGGAHPAPDQQPIDIDVPPCDSATLAP